MSTYKQIRGLKVRDYTTNPDNPIEGQLWYNTTDNVAKYRIPNLLASSASWKITDHLPCMQVVKSLWRGMTFRCCLEEGGTDTVERFIVV